MPDYTPTFADLCSAIADGGVIATLDGSMYEVNACELRRYFHRANILPGIPSLQHSSLPESGDASLSHPQPGRPVQRH